MIEVNQPHAHTRGRRGKSDAVDTEAAARKVLAGECTVIPKDTTSIVEAIRQLLGTPPTTRLGGTNPSLPARATKGSHAAGATAGA